MLLTHKACLFSYTKDIPEGQSLYDFANETELKEKQVYLLDKLGLNNTYAIAVPEDIASQYNLENVSDLISVADKLVFGAEHEFFSEEGSMKFNPFVKFYGLDFKESKPVDIGLIFDDETMADLTYALDVEGQDVEKVAKRFLEEKGLLQ